MGKRKHQSVIEASEEEAENIEFEVPAEEGNESEPEAPAEERVTKKSKKKKKKKKPESSDDEISDIEKRYVSAVRVKVDDGGDVHRLDGKLADLDEKVIDVSEDEWKPDDPLNMPPQGILVEGLPFHHCFPYPLKRHHISRLYAHGIIIKNSAFSAGEDAQILENWKKFSEKNGIDYEDAPIYCGWAKHLGIANPMSMKKIHRKTKFLPYMCAGLLQRCAIQVYRRCYRIFDPRSDEFGRQNEREWTEEENERLRNFYALEGPSWQKLAVKLGRNRFQVQCHYQRVICGEKPQLIPVEGKTKLLWKKDDDRGRFMIYDYVKDYLPAHPIVLVTRGVGENEDRNMNWQRLCKKYSNLTPDYCVAEWTKIKAVLRSAYNRANDPNITFTTIEKTVFGETGKKCHNLRPKSAAAAFKVMHELAKEKEIEELWELDVAELTTRLKEAKIIFRSSYTLGSHIMKTAHKILIILRNENFLRLLPPSTTIVDLIEMLGYFMKQSHRKLKLSKIQCLHFIQKYIKHKGWTPNDKYEIIDKNELAEIEALRAEDSDAEGNILKGNQSESEQESDLDEEMNDEEKEDSEVENCAAKDGSDEEMPSEKEVSEVENGATKKNSDSDSDDSS